MPMRMTFEPYMRSMIRDDLKELFLQYLKDADDFDDADRWIAKIEELDYLSLDDLIKTNLEHVHSDELVDVMTTRVKVFVKIMEKEVR